MSSEQLSEPTEESKILPWHRAIPKCYIYTVAGKGLMQNHSGGDSVASRCWI